MTNFALIIGINHYEKLRSLNGAIEDAKSFKECLIKIGEVTSENCFYLQSTDIPNFKPIQNEIDNYIGQLIDKVKILINENKQIGRLYFYFSGHGLGVLDNTKNTGLCLPIWSEFMRNSALSSEGYKEILKQFGYFSEIFFFLDCCRNTKIKINPLEPQFAPLNSYGNTSVFIGYATQYQDQAFEVENDNNQKRGIFTQVLVKALEGGALDITGNITISTLSDYLNKNLPIEAQKNNYRQKPEIIIENFTNLNQIILKGTLVKFNCNINFNSTPSIIEISDGFFNFIQRYNENLENNIQIQLHNGLYKLVNLRTNETRLIEINGVDVNVRFQ